jgi:hypothetical protein
MPLYNEFSEILSKMNTGHHVKHFSSDFRNMLKCQISWKSVQWEPSCSARTDGHMTKLTVVFRNFANAPKNEWNGKLSAMLTQKFLSAHFHDLQLFKNYTTKESRRQFRDINITRLLFHEYNAVTGQNISTDRYFWKLNGRGIVNRTRHKSSFWFLI